MENHNQKIYSQEAILALAAAIGRDDDAFNWLMENDNKELAALADVLLYRKSAALEWLKNNQFSIIVSFIGALGDEEDAINYLMLNHAKQWAATADLVNGNEEAQDWLAQFFPHFGKLADSLISNSWPVRRRGYGGGNW
ncbi:MAG TPA: hypothetical protein VFJ43_09050 [Bacteroidia bacterium]|nr:hypothetical protein [Bacteroidia bacterium]